MRLQKNGMMSRKRSWVATTIHLCLVLLWGGGVGGEKFKACLIVHCAGEAGWGDRPTKCHDNLDFFLVRKKETQKGLLFPTKGVWRVRYFFPCGEGGGGRGEVFQSFAGFLFAMPKHAFYLSKQCFYRMGVCGLWSSCGTFLKTLPRPGKKNVN